MRPVRRPHGWGIIFRGSGALALAVAGSTLVACTDEPAGAPERVDPLSAGVRAPTEPVVVVPGDTAPELAAGTSAALFEQSPVVVVATDGDLAAQGRAASVAVSLGAPLLLAPDGNTPVASSTSVRGAAPASTGSGVMAIAPSAAAVDAAARGEIARLGPRAVVTFGEHASRWVEDAGLDATLVAAPASADAVDDVIGRALGADQAVAPDQLTDAVAALERDQPALLTVEPSAGAEPEDDSAGDQPATDPGPEGELPRVEPDDALDSLLVLVSRGPGSLAAAVTARASGAQLMVVDHPDPRADPDAVAALARRPPDQVMALGTGFGGADLLRQRVDVAATGVELPGGGQVVYPGRHMVALYGHPGAPALGVLGEQGVDAAVSRAHDLAADYQPLVDEPVIPAFEIIATVASAGPGDDGNYSHEAPVDELRPWIEAADEAGVYVVLDLQPGRTDFLTQAKRYEDLLALPHVGLALDPEWRLTPDQVHLRQVGSVSAAEVNSVVTWLADLTRDRTLPQKLLLLHQFQAQMITDRPEVDTSRDELAVVIHADGFGSPEAKFDTWDAMQASPPSNVWWGWKNFVDEDTPTFSPDQTMAIEPQPRFVSYQ